MDSCQELLLRSSPSEVSQVQARSLDFVQGIFSRDYKPGIFRMSFLRGVVSPPQGASVQFLRALAQCGLLMIAMAISLYMREVYSQSHPAV